MGKNKSFGLNGRGIGHKNMYRRSHHESYLKKDGQKTWLVAQPKLSHGGTLRKKRSGRGARPLSTKEPIHLVFKLRYQQLRQRSLRAHRSFALCSKILWKYSAHFYVQIEQVSIQYDHIHILARAKKRTQLQHFLRVVAGQIAQQFEKEGLLFGLTSGVTDTPKQADPLRVTDTSRQQKKPILWIHRPFSRVVRWFRAYKIVRNYIQLNEKEATGVIPYRKTRLRGLSISDWQILWS